MPKYLLFFFVLTTVATMACDKPSNAAAESPETEPSSSGYGVEIHGHRGARGLRPEHTLPSIEAALDSGVASIELDVHLSHDDQVVVWHDPYVLAQNCRYGSARDAQPYSRAGEAPKRAFEASVIDPDTLPPLHPATAIRNQPAKKLRKLICDRNPDPTKFPLQKPIGGSLSGDDFGILTLRELLAFVDRYANSKEKSDAQRRNAAEVGFTIEAKRTENFPTFIADGFDGDSPALFEKAIHEVLTDAGVLDRVIFQSFDWRALTAFRKLAPDVPLVALERHAPDRETARSKPDVTFEELAEMKVTTWAPYYKVLNAELVASAQKAGLRVVPWTVNDPEHARALVKLGVDGLITDRPDIIKE